MKHSGVEIMNETGSGQAVSATDVTARLPITRLVAQICYGLFIAGCFLPPLLLVALVTNLMRRERAEGTWIESHFRRQLRDFLKLAAVLAVIVGPLLIPGVAYLFAIIPVIGLPILSIAVLAFFSVAVIFIIRMATGWRTLLRNEEI